MVIVTLLVLRLKPDQLWLIIAALILIQFFDIAILLKHHL